VADERVSVSGTVGFNDIDLSRPEGRSLRDQRIATAVDRACGRADSRDLGVLADVRRCRREAMASATSGRDLAIASRTRREAVAMVAVNSTVLPRWACDPGDGRGSRAPRENPPAVG
jgi:UrcA family protein